MRHITPALLLISALLATACGPSDRANTIAGLTGDATSGQTLFSANCASCHGAMGGGGSGPNLVSAFNETDEAAEHIDVILEGEGAMQAFGDSLSDQEIADIVSYLEGL
jgi:mono/diheme cytochrome c family protein